MKQYSSKAHQLDQHLDNDDMPIGRILSRREVIALLGTTGAATILSACTPIAPVGDSTPGAEVSGSVDDEAAVELSTAAAGESVPTVCVVRPEMTEGPLFVDEDLQRVDIRTDPSSGAVSQGAPLDLTFRVSRLDGSACAPLAGVQVDIWQCDAMGIYSDTSQLGMQTVGQKFLRGYQITDENGIARFVTIYPGWYSGRTVHIHVKIRTNDGYDFTSQLFFDDALSDEVFTLPPYNSRGERRIRNENDGIFRNGGQQTLLAPHETEDGYAATFDVALDLGAS